MRRRALSAPAWPGVRIQSCLSFPSIEDRRLFRRTRRSCLFTVFCNYGGGLSGLSTAGGRSGRKFEWSFNLRRDADRKTGPANWQGPSRVSLRAADLLAGLYLGPCPRAQAIQLRIDRRIGEQILLHLVGRVDGGVGLDLRIDQLQRCGVRAGVADIVHAVGRDLRPVEVVDE